ncbi:CPBP family intramembrane glutamic endopeptidase [Aeromicrobium sp. Sec7.5]|uniref:CPBP family intramembrane glutamic endopeptidase n=1 Tax=Aeromicrobium sp. Sec7.5 TaxID=3121276 RepID=UPI002FE4DC4F
MATPYHRLAREHPDHEWWKLPVAGLIGTMGYVIVSSVLGVGLVVVLLVTARDDPGTFDRWLDELVAGTTSSPWVLAVMLASIALLLPAVLLSVLATGPRPVGYLSSVQGRLRWGWLARVTAVAFALYGAVIVGSLALGLGGDVTGPSLDDQALLYVLIALLLVPFQATAEEYVFRGYLFQLVGSWTRFAIIPVLVSTPLFVAGHLYEFWGLVDVTIFALMASYLVIRTGGLEAAIAAHVANNLVLFTLEGFNVLLVTTEEYGPVDVLPTLLTSVVFVLLVELMARAEGLQRTRAPLPPKPPPPPPMWGPPWPYPYLPQPYGYPVQPYGYPVQPYGHPAQPYGYPPQAPYPYPHPPQDPFGAAPALPPVPPPPPGATHD